MSQENVPYEESELYKIRHTAAHVMAEAVLQHYPDAKLAFGPPVEDGFYYDFDLGQNEAGKPITFSEEDLEKIEATTKKLLKKNAPLERSTMSIAEAKVFFADQPFKQWQIDSLAEGKVDEDGNATQEAALEVGIYKHREFADLCRGPHVAFTKKVKANAVKLIRSSGAYWLGDEKNQQLQRIYGTAWANKEELEAYLKLLEEAAARDHRRLGKQLELFHISPLVGAGLPLWLPNGTILRDNLETFLKKKQIERGYLPVITPHIGKLELYKTSGHYPYYKDSQYTPIDVDDEQYMLKPMNCPHHIEIYKSKGRSYRDLPLRLAEFGSVYRYEKSGELSGLTRVRGFTVDDSHLFVTPDQLNDEFINVVELVKEIFATMGFADFRARLGTNDPDSDKYAGSPEIWEKGITAIRSAVQQLGLPYTEEVGEAAFYGPKLDFIVRDVLKREWQLGTVQVDFLLPERFDIEYIGEDGAAHRPVMIHRAPFGSMERFTGILIEHFNGAFPLWLAPVQAMVVPITDRNVEYGKQVAAELKAAGFRVSVDDGNERMNKKIRNAQMMKIPYMLVIGDQEQEAGTIAVRTRENENRGAMPVAEFMALIQDRVETQSQEL
ncbi:MAG: threonyl-tRNA synthetase [Cellvibrionaceae bacterium]|jgi:threonyl-tRNA synthetase